MPHITHVPLSSLSIDERANVRKTGRGAEPRFVGSIRAKGIIDPLTVRPNGNGYKVVNGGKRLAALQFLAKEKGEANGTVVTSEYPVPVVIRDESDAEARDTSLIANIVRAEMHPADECEAFAKLRSEGMEIDDIAARYAVDERRVRQRLALGSLSPTILDAWRRQEISFDTAKAFTMAPSRKEQERIYKQLSEEGGAIHECDVRAAFAGDADEGGALVQFVGIDAYVKRGGKVTEDLFGADHFISDIKLAQQMAAEKLEAECDRLIREGWSFAIPKSKVKDQWNWGQVKVDPQPTADEEARIRHLEKIFEADGDGSDEARCELNELEKKIALRSFTPAQKSRSGCWLSIDGNGNLVIDAGKVKPEERKEAAKIDKAESRKAAASPAVSPEKKKEPASISNAMRERLKEQRTRAIKLCLVEDLSDGDELVRLLAGIVAAQIKPERPSWMPREVSDNLEKIAKLMTGAKVNAHIRKQFDAKDYFGGAPKPFLLKAISEAINADEARKVSAKPKSEIARFAIANVPKTGWLPPELRTAHYDGPGGAKNGKGGPARKKRAS